VPKTYKVLLSRHAQDDLAGIYDYISADNPRRAAGFILALEEKILSLANMPERTPMIPENLLLGTRYRHLLHQDYRVIFRTQEDTVLVLRVFHGAQLLRF
jgi:toxin ParE1/3/4